MHRLDVSVGGPANFQKQNVERGDVASLCVGVQTVEVRIDTKE